MPTPAPAAPIEATIHVTIEHVAGPAIADPNHVRRWLAADQVFPEGVAGGWEYDVCPLDPDPEECGDHYAEDAMSTYRVSIVGADW